MTLKIGDVVWLKSGGPPMTVTTVFHDNATDDVTCGWFNENDGITFTRVPTSALTAEPAIKFTLEPKRKAK